MWDGTLEIKNSTENDAGLYSCFAENDRGKANSSGYLTITGLWTCAYCISVYLNRIKNIFSDCGKKNAIQLSISAFFTFIKLNL